MKFQKIQRIKYIKILELLQDSDEDNPLDTVSILDALRKQGIVIDRKILYKDMELLNELGYEIICQRAKRNLYYIVDRKFSVPELKILIDAIESATFIDKKNTAEFTQKIASMGGTMRQQLLLRETRYVDSTAKHSNTRSLYVINELEQAMLEKKKVQFKYFQLNYKGEKEYRKNEPYIVNPITTIQTNNNYYLVCYSEKEGIFRNYRIDRMEDAQVLKEPRVDHRAIDEFDAGKYASSSFNMFGGASQEVTLNFPTELVSVIHDKFGESIKITKKEDETFEVKVNVFMSSQFYGMVLGLDGKMKITAPSSAVEEFDKYIQKLVQAYN